MALLQKFCASRYDGREYLRKPILRGDHVYATNGHIMIRVPKGGLVAAELAYPKGLAEMFDKAKSGLVPWQFVDLPPLPPLKACAFCGGSGKAYQCPSCDGEGYFIRDDEDCAKCGGSGQVTEENPHGQVECGNCAGYGNEFNIRVEAGNAGYADIYLHMIADLPGLEFASRGEEAAYFTFDGGDGLLMPRRA